jgi:hypothetical protein
MNTIVYLLALDWYTEGVEFYAQEPMKYYFFDKADAALDLADKICFSKNYYKDYNEPKNMYLFKVKPGEPFMESNRWQAAWFDVDRKLR